MAVKRKRRQPRKHNPAAKLLRTPAYRPRVVKSKKAYSRKSKPVEPAEPRIEADGAERAVSRSYRRKTGPLK